MCADICLETVKLLKRVELCNLRLCLAELHLSGTTSCIQSESRCYRSLEAASREILLKCQWVHCNEEQMCNVTLCVGFKLKSQHYMETPPHIISFEQAPSYAFDLPETDRYGEYSNFCPNMRILLTGPKVHEYAHIRAQYNANEVIISDELECAIS